MGRQKQVLLNLSPTVGCIHVQLLHDTDTRYAYATHLCQHGGVAQPIDSAAVNKPPGPALLVLQSPSQMPRQLTRQQGGCAHSRAGEESKS